MEYQLLAYNSRVNSKETSLCKMHDVAALPPVTQNPSALDTSPIFPICKLPNTPRLVYPQTMILVPKTKFASLQTPDVPLLLGRS